MDKVIIDVRERDEFAIEHVKDSINVPLSVFNIVAPGVLNQLKNRDILFLCHSGMRAAQAQTLAQSLGYNAEHNYSVYEGGVMQWKKDGNEIVAGDSRAFLSLQRQVQLIIGGLVLAFGVLGMLVNPWFSIAAAATGAGLFIAGATGYCLMAQIVGSMPWNKGKKEANCTPCEAKSL